MQDAPNNPRHPWEQKLHEATGRIEDEVRRVVQYLDEEIVPDVRRSSSEALRSASLRLAELARHLDDKNSADTTKGQK